jgi:hypothetical protein
VARLDAGWVFSLASRSEIVRVSSSWCHTLAISSSRGNRGEEGTTLMIVAALMALFADHVFGLVASSRRNYLVEFNDYLDGRGLRPRPTVRTTRA